jgi:DUF971 family protein
MSANDPIEPVRTTIFPNGELGLVWPDGSETYLSGYDLRCACNCAQCVEEMTGRPLLDRSSVPREVRPVEVVRVGRYGLGIRFSDDHDTGIFAYARLRALGATSEAGADGSDGSGETDEPGGRPADAEAGD